MPDGQIGYFRDSLRSYGDGSNVNHPKRRNIAIPRHSVWKTRLVEDSFPDRSFDIEFWQEQSDGDRKITVIYD